MIIPAYRLGFSVEISPGEFAIRTRRRHYMCAFAVQVHLLGYRQSGNTWAFIQCGDRAYWLRRP